MYTVFGTYFKPLTPNHEWCLDNNPQALSSYLYTAIQESGEHFGVAVRIGSSISFNVETTKVIYSILSMAVEFLNELAKVSGMECLG